MRTFKFIKYIKQKLTTKNKTMESKIKTAKDAYELLKYPAMPESPDTSWIPEKHREYMVNHNNLIIVAEALVAEYSKANNLKNNWEPNYTDGSSKYAVWFEIKADKNTPSGFAFSCTDYCDWLTYTGVAARLLFPTAELAVYFGTQFKEMHLIDKLIRIGAQSSSVSEIEKMRCALEMIVAQCDGAGNIKDIATKALQK